MHEQAPALDNLACLCEAPQGAVAIHFKEVLLEHLFFQTFNIIDIRFLFIQLQGK